MNNEDITLSLGVDVSSVKGIDELIKKLTHAVNAGVGRSLTSVLKRETSLLNKRLNRIQSIDRSEEDPVTAKRQELQGIVGAYESFVGAVPERTQSAPILAATYRRLRARRQQLSAFLPETMRLANAQRLEEINVSLNRMRAIQRFEKAHGKTMEWFNDTNYGKELGATPEERITNMQMGLAALRKDKSALAEAKKDTKAFHKAYADLRNALLDNISVERESIKATKDNTTTLSDGIRFAGIAGSIMGVAGAIGSGVSAYSNIMAAGYGDPIHGWTSKRSAKASSLGTWGAIGGGLLGVLGGAIAGGLTGAGAGVVGGPAGSVAGTVIGAITGALKGGALGAGVGGVGGKAAGDWWGKNITRELSSQEDFIKSYRWSALYGDRLLRDRYATLVETTGMASSADVEGLANMSTTIGAAAAFGGISDQQWLALSMHPNYFAALMNGASEAELLTAYRKDAEALGPGMAQYFVGSLPGMNENLRAFAMSPLLGYTNADIQNVLGQQHLMDLLRIPGIKQTYGRVQKDYAERVKTWTDETPDVLDAPPNLPSLYNEAELRRMLGYPDNLTKRDLNIIIDGESHTVGEVYTDDSGPIGTMLQYLAGSAV